MKRQFRLTRSGEFRRVRRVGQSFAHPFMVLITTPCDNPTIKIGVTTSHSLGNAVQRNRAKRRIRACIDQFLPSLAAGHEIIILARRPILTAAHAEICQVMRNLIERSGLMVERGFSHAENGIGIPE